MLCFSFIEKKCTLMMRLGTSGCIQVRPGASGCIRVCPDPSGSIRVHPGPSQSIWVHPGQKKMKKGHKNKISKEFEQESHLLWNLFSM